MSTGAIVGIVIAILLIAAIAAIVMLVGRRRRLKERFGPEYDRVAGERSGLAADAELAQRERRVRDLEIRPLSAAARDGYAARWAAIQEQFVDAPQAAVADAQALVTRVMNERGYPTDDHEQVLADLSVEHGATVDHFRSAHEISQQAASGGATTEDLRRAMIHYRELFGELLGTAPEPAAGDASAYPGLAGAGTAGRADTMPDADITAVPDAAANGTPGNGRSDNFITRQER